ncbi:MAG TPA: hypothetical protein VMC83_26510 [Streptosporangiaceae bacterium]|nr:hypothetical protein [Streptosporangiaceae bacterium]
MGKVTAALFGEIPMTVALTALTVCAARSASVAQAAERRDR